MKAINYACFKLEEETTTSAKKNKKYPCFRQMCHGN